MDKWTNQIAVVTGAASGIGWAISQALANHGMVVVGLDIQLEKLQKAADTFRGQGKIIAMEGDVTNESMIEEVFKTIERDIGPVRVLVNNAGVFYVDELLDFTIDNWKKNFDVNFFGGAICTKQIIQALRKDTKRELVQVININSIAGHVMLPIPQVHIYCLTKHCVTFFTRQLNLSTSDLNIKFSSISPGLTSTDLLSGISYLLPPTDPRLKPEDIANAAIIVLSAEPNVMIAEFTVKPKGERC